MTFIVTIYHKTSNYILQLTNFRKYFLIYLFLISFLSFFIVSIPVKIAIAKIQQPEPQGILVLGGSPNREKFTAKFAAHYENIPIWLSSGINRHAARNLFDNAGINFNRVYVDRRATDTVTNFTSLVNDFQQHQIKHLFVITSNYHLSRASAIATIVLGSRGIAFIPIGVPGIKPQESPLKVTRDIIRAFIWVFTGYTGANLKVIK